MSILYRSGTAHVSISHLRSDGRHSTSTSFEEPDIFLDQLHGWQANWLATNKGPGRRVTEWAQQRRPDMSMHHAGQSTADAARWSCTHVTLNVFDSTQLISLSFSHRILWSQNAPLLDITVIRARSSWVKAAD